MLQRCFPQSIRRTLDELPNSLDETYERVLKEIGMANRDHAHRLLLCLTVAIRPLRVDELAEILALDFDVAEGMTPKLNTDWRWKDRQRAVLSACSSLITVVDDGDSHVIQFSHFSVKEFLTSDRLSTSTSGVSDFHITPEPAHMTLVQACLGTLLHLDDNSTKDQVEDSFPLARYASQHWVEHAQFGMVSSRIEDGIRRLFDPAQPYLASWLQLHDVDDVCFLSGKGGADRGSLLYYTSLCGFRDLAARVIVDHPEQVNARGGRNHSPLVAALYKRRFSMAELLYQHGAIVDVPFYRNQTPLLLASGKGLVDVVQWLLDHGADANWHDDSYWTPIHNATAFSRKIGICLILLTHGSDSIPAATEEGYAPASYPNYLQTMRLLLQHGADVNAQDKDHLTPLHWASRRRRLKDIRLLLDHNANIDAEDKKGITPLHLASSNLGADVISLLLDRGADPNAEDKEGSTPLHLVSSGGGNSETISLLVGCGASANAMDKDGWTPLHLASSNGKTATAQSLLELGANANANDKDKWTPLHLASSKGHTETVRLLLDRGANENSEDKDEWTPLHLASSKGHTETVRLLLDRGANENSEDKEGWTPLHLAASDGYTETVRLLLDHGANANAEDKEGWTPLHLASSDGHAMTVRLLLDRGASVDVKNKKRRTPLQVASKQGMEDVVQILAEHGAEVYEEL